MSVRGLPRRHATIHSRRIEFLLKQQQKTHQLMVFRTLVWGFNSRRYDLLLIKKAFGDPNPQRQ